MLGDVVGEVEISPFVDGAPTPSLASEDFEGVNPANGLSIGRVPQGCAQDVDNAVASARRAFEGAGWSATGPSTRKQALHGLADLLNAHAPALDACDAEEMGKPISLAMGNAAAAARLLRFYAEAVDKLNGDVFPSDGRSLVLDRRTPQGVVGAITPWNFPCVNAVRKIGPALAAGNCVVLKPSELASRSALRIAHLALEAGIPPGVLNVVPGVGSAVGAALANHMDVDLVTFTGSTQVGKRILAAAAQSNMKQVVAECGGKSPQIVFDDGVDLDGAATAVARSILNNQGQVCSAGSRLLVQRSIHRDVVERVVAIMSKVVIGDPRDPATTFGPLVTRRQCSRVMSFIEAARAEGLRPIVGGRRTLSETGGFFVEPTLFDDAPPDSALAQQEIFGPVLSVIPFDTDAEAIAIANATIYGLVAYVWTADLSRGLRVSKAVRASVFLNAAPAAGEGAGHAASFEPFNQSGLGAEGGLAGLASYLRRQTIWISHA